MKIQKDAYHNDECRSFETRQFENSFKKKI